MTDKKITDRDVKIIYIPPMTVASIHCIGGNNPELETIKNINRFIEENNLIKIKPDFRHFGFNHSNGNEHGYERWVSIPENMTIKTPFIKKQFCGGLYAAYMIPMGLFQEWELFKNWMTNHEKYKIVPHSLEYTDGLMEEHLNWIHKYKSIPSYNDQSIQIDLLIPIEEKMLEE
jgi:DNA gyrase inhibitor GyrI